VLLIVGGMAAFFVVLVVAAAFWLMSPPKASASARQPFDLADIGVQEFPENFENLDAGEGVDAREIVIGAASGGGATVRLWVYLPVGERPNGSLSCVLIAPAGSNLITGMGLAEGDMNEHLPYVAAGFAVVAYALPGEFDEDLTGSYQAFKDSRAGLINARVALEYVLKEMPEVNPERIYTAGHSSAGSAAMLFAAHESRLSGCVAYAPCCDILGSMPAALTRLFGFACEGLADFATQASPSTHFARIECPVFLFCAEDDTDVDIVSVRGSVGALEELGKSVRFETVASGGHYDSMIEEGIPLGIAWMRGLEAAKSKAISREPAEK
jgi:dipeptidyl aminopeptidase/acylaminoacyl peptidase